MLIRSVLEARITQPARMDDIKEPRAPGSPSVVPAPREVAFAWPREQVPLAVLALSLLLTVASTAFVAVSGRSRDRARFENAVQSTRDRIASRMETYLAMLHGASGLFAASGEVTRAEFKAYIDRLEFPVHYPGAQGLGYVRRVSAADRTVVERRMRSEGIADFRIWPRRDENEAYAIAFLEPLDRRNAVALGFDMLDDSTRAAAIVRARDTGLPTLSGPTILKQEIDAEKQTGLLLYVPVYRSREPPATVAGRRELIEGLVYTPFRARDLFERIFGSERHPRVSFRVFDGSEKVPGRLIYDSRGDSVAEQRNPPFSETAQLAIGGRTWTLDFEPTSVATPFTGSIFAPLVAMIGLVLSLALYVLTRSQVEARSAAERNEAARNRFFAAMSHELRTPLNAIIGYNDLLLAGVYGELPVEHARGIDRSQKAAKHLLELVNDVLDLSKIEAGKIDLEIDSVQIPVLIEDLFATIRPMAESRQSELRFEDRGCTERIRTDPRRVRQILLNLLSNATKFGAGHPVIVSCTCAHDGATIEVHDSGPGIPARDIPRIFDEFVQLPSNPHGGTGLGLPISRRLAHLLGARLEVDSTVGAGSTFRLILPAETPHPDSRSRGRSGYAKSESGSYRAV